MVLLTQKKLALIQNWWILAIRGVSSFAFGMYFLAYPDLALFLLVRSFVFFAVLDGLLGLIAAFLIIKSGPWRTFFIVTAAVDAATAAVALIQPVVTAYLLFLMVGPMIILTGLAEIIGGLMFRNVLSGARWLTMGGALTLAVGVALFGSKLTNQIWVEQLIGAFMIIHGVTYIGLAFRLKYKR
jgi:uncharacterized membrane protein HdeD (DUF308 family)